MAPSKTSPAVAIGTAAGIEPFPSHLFRFPGIVSFLSVRPSRPIFLVRATVVSRNGQKKDAAKCYVATSSKPGGGTACRPAPCSNETSSWGSGSAQSRRNWPVESSTRGLFQPITVGFRPRTPLSRGPNPFEVEQGTPRWQKMGCASTSPPQALRVRKYILDHRFGSDAFPLGRLTRNL